MRIFAGVHREEHEYHASKFYPLIVIDGVGYVFRATLYPYLIEEAYRVAEDIGGYLYRASERNSNISLHDHVLFLGWERLE